ncbi:MAG: ATP-binding protein, partial [Lachnospiraceae bacterium]|nr:ATP-binding protein [Lachnospiraceae bacterium]
MDYSDIAYLDDEEYLSDLIEYTKICQQKEDSARLKKAAQIHSRIAMTEAADRLPRMERCLDRIGGDDFHRAALALLLSERWDRDAFSSKPKKMHTLASLIFDLLLPKNIGILGAFLSARGYERSFSLLFPALRFSDDAAHEPLILDERLVDILLGWNPVSLPELSIFIPENEEPFPQTLLGFFADSRRRLEAFCDGANRAVLLWGKEGSGKHLLLKELASKRGEAVVFCDLSGDPSEARQTILLALRECVLLDRWLAIEGMAALDDDTKKQLDSFLKDEILDDVKRLFLVMDSEEKPSAFSWCAKISPPSLTEKERFLWWQELLRDEVLEEDVDLFSVANTFALTPGAMQNAKEEVVSGIAEGDSITKKDLYGACYEQLPGGLGQKAVRLDPVFEWDDLILKDREKALLSDICNCVKTRHIVMGEWNFQKTIPYGAGTSCLFAGPPGTGKTMAARVLANELSMELYRIDLSQVIDKYVGETEKNIKQIFDEAERMSCILFFDEGDAIFGKRVEATGANERFANIESSLLLQCIEDYNGVSILATNNQGRLDPAFIRRFKYYLRFSEPDREERLAIFSSAIPKEAPLDEEVDLALL